MKGGIEKAFMSTTTELKVAAEFAASGVGGKIGVVNTYLMAASSDAPHVPLLFPNSAKIFGISWDMHGFESSNLSSNPRAGRNVVVL